MKTSPLCNLESIPEGKSIGDINPAFSGLKGEMRLGKMSSFCASCRKPFNATRKPRREVRLYPAELQIPVGWAYHLCGSCFAMYQRGGQHHAAVLASIESFHLCEKPDQ